MRQDVHAAPNSELTHIQAHSGMKIRRSFPSPGRPPNPAGWSTHAEAGREIMVRISKSFGEAKHAEWN
jgi:hypothetical protein